MNNYNLIRIKQHFRNSYITDVKGEVAKELIRLRPLIKPGANIALAVGSRGINNLEIVVKEVVAFLKENRANPFIIPAMGSHGGATARGQAEILAAYGYRKKLSECLSDHPWRLLNCLRKIHLSRFIWINMHGNLME